MTTFQSMLDHIYDGGEDFWKF